jgi:hypothetical protein
MKALIYELGDVSGGKALLQERRERTVNITML